MRFNRILEVPSSDPEVARRAQLLNICILAVGAAALVLAVFNAIQFSLTGDAIARSLMMFGIIGFAGSLLAYILNKRHWYRPAGYLFLMLIVYIITSATQPAQYLFEGSTILAYVLPIIMASVVLEPWSSFLITTVIAVVLFAVARGAGIYNNPTAETLVTMYMLAMVAWLSARSLNQALNQAREHATELRKINLELDKRVAERTTDLQEANQRLTQAVQREHSESNKNQTILEGIADGVIVFDADRHAIVANPAVEAMFDLPRRQIIGAEISKLIEMSENSEARRAVNAAFSRQIREPARFNFPLGAQIIAAILALVDLPNEGKGVVAVLHDITKEVEADRAKSEFVSTVSHELRTPLTSIKGYTDLLYMNAVGELNEEQKKFLYIIKVNADRLTALLTDLLDISRVETGRIRLDMKEVFMDEIVNDVVASLQPEIQRKGLHLTVNITPGMQPVRGDRGRIVQIMNNLLSNAYRYTPAGGIITVGVSQSDSMLRVDVTDTGIGISPKDQARLFARFYRADDPRVREISGTGLGLAITRMFVELHGGRIWVQSELNKGSTFTFVLPTIRSEARPAPATEVAPAANKVGPKRKVLVVEDDQSISELIRHHLMSAGYEVAAVGLGREVIPKVRSWRPDMLTLDVLLPDMDGFEVLRELKASPDMANVPVIVLSVLHDRENGLQLGAADYLTKPIRGKDLLESVERALGEMEEAKGRTILVVDDEPDVRRWLRDALAVHGFRVTEAGDGQEAMEQVARERPDLILLDLKMPRMDGYTALKQLKNDRAKADIPIVVLTASSINKERDEMRLLDMGAKRFLTKPIGVDELVGEIEQQLAAKVKAKE